MTKINPRWSPNMMRRPGSTHEAQQVRCLTEIAAYDANVDFADSLNDCYRAVRERVAAGGKAWEPK